MNREASLLRAKDRVFFVGDSMTAGETRPFGFVTLVQQAFDEQRPADKLVATSRGYWAAPSRTLQNAVVGTMKEKPTHVVIYFGLNDSRFGNDAKNPENYASNLRLAVEGFKKHGARSIICTPTVWRTMKQAAPHAEVAVELNVPTLDLCSAFDRYLRTAAKFKDDEFAHLGGGGSMVLKGMDAGCTPTLPPAGGLLNLPNFGTHHKRNRMTALALIHVPDNPFWTSYAVADKLKSKPTGATPIRRVGYHFGAPGDRQADDGTLWFAVGPKKLQGVVIAGKDLDWFTMHPGQTGHWLGSAGVLGATDVSVPTSVAAGKAQPDKTPRRYDVKLTFVEPSAVKAGQRVFDISLEGKVVLKGLDIAKEAGGSHRPITREFRDVEITGPLNIRLTPTVGKSLLSGVEIREK